MYMDKEKFDEIKKKYPTLLVMDSDEDDAFSFVQEVLEAEADALKEKCPSATRSIEEMETAVRQVWSVQRDVENEEFGESA